MLRIMYSHRKKILKINYRAVGSFFMVGGLSNSVDHHNWPTTKNALKQSQKTKFGPKYKKSHIWNSFAGNIISGIQSFYVSPDVPVDFIRAFI